MTKTLKLSLIFQAASIGLFLQLPLKSNLCYAINQLALTIDDIPSAGTDHPTLSKLEIAKQIIGHLQKHKIPVPYGFINGATLENQVLRYEVMKEWKKAGYPFGNHTYSHKGYSASTIEEFKKDIEKNEPFLLDFAKNIAEFKVLRLPFLQEGDTSDKRYMLRSYLKDRSYQVAQVTIDFEDWSFNEAYMRCVKIKDQRSMNKIKDLYLTKASDAMNYANRAVQVIWGRDKKIKHIMLVHFNAVLAAFGDDLFKLVAEKNWQWVSSIDAMSDPTYAEDTTYIGADGKTFLDQAIITRKIKSVRTPLSLEAKMEKFCR